MEARSLKRLLLLFLFAYAKCEDVGKIIKIQKLTKRISDDSPVDNTLVCLESAVTGVTGCVLTHKSGTDAENDYAGVEGSEDNMCGQFDVPISALTGEGTFVIKCENDQSQVLANANLIVPDVESINAQLIGDGATGKRNLRVYGIKDPSSSWNIILEDGTTYEQCTVLDKEVCFVINTKILDDSPNSVCEKVINSMDTGDGTVDVCSAEILTKLVPTEDLTISKVTLIYTDKKIEIELTDPSTFTSYDVVAYHDDTGKLNSNQNPIGSAIYVQSDSFAPSDLKIDVFVVGLNEDGATEGSQYTSLQDYKLVATLFSSTIEMEWENIEKTIYYAELVVGESTPFKNTDVDCNSLTNCYAYFLEVSSSDNTVQVQPYVSTDPGREKNNKNIIKADVTSTKTSEKSTGLRIQDIYLHWSSNILTVDARVCFHGEATGLTQYQLVLVDSKGRWRRVHGASHTREGRLCFSELTLDSRQFNTGEEVAVLVIKRDVDGRTVLASGESHVFFIAPKVEVVSGHVGLVSWGNPGGYTVSTRKESHPASVTDTTTGKLRHYFVPRRTGDKLVVKADASGVKMTAVVPLTRREVDAAAGM